LSPPPTLQIQYYNQGDDQYNTCENLLFDSGSSFPDSSVFQTHTVSGVPLEKLVIGKPINAGAAANGYMDAATLNGCVNQAKAKGWNAGVMYWEYDSTAVGTILAVVG
jgi:chitinase